MLTNTGRYMRETCVLAGAFPHGVNHDDSVNQRDEESRLHKGWLDTQRLWREQYTTDCEREVCTALEFDAGEEAAVDKVDKAGATYRGEPPGATLRLSFL
jgi:hypothetical protein